MLWRFQTINKAGGTAVSDNIGIDSIAIRSGSKSYQKKMETRSPFITSPRNIGQFPYRRGSPHHYGSRRINNHYIFKAGIQLAERSVLRNCLACCFILWCWFTGLMRFLTAYAKMLSSESSRSTFTLLQQRMRWSAPFNLTESPDECDNNRRDLIALHTATQCTQY